MRFYNVMVDSRLHELAGKAEFWTLNEDQLLWSACAAQTEKLENALPSLQNSLAQLSEQCSALRVTCSMIESDFARLAEVNKASVLIDPFPQQPRCAGGPIAHHTSEPTDTPFENILLAGVQALFQWEQTAADVVALPHVYGSAEYLQDPDCGIPQDIDGSTATQQQSAASGSRIGQPQTALGTLEGAPVAAATGSSGELAGMPCAVDRSDGPADAPQPPIANFKSMLEAILHDNANERIAGTNGARKESRTYSDLQSDILVTASEGLFDDEEDD